MSSADPETDRALGALVGLAIGDALGMPTQMMSRDAIAGRFGVITGFEAADTDHPLAHGMAAASVTDDTEQAVLVARALVAGHGHVDPTELARLLADWEDDMRGRGSLDLLGPSTKRAIDSIAAGTPVAEAGRYGVTNGAAMRITPLGLAVTTDDIASLVDRVQEVSSATHNTGIAIAGASAIAAAVSAGIAGVGVAGVIDMAISAAVEARSHGYWVAGADVARRIERAVGGVDAADVTRSLDFVAAEVGTSLATQESVPAAFALFALYPDDPWQACLAAANLGGDSDTIAAMAGAIGGARNGVAAFPADAVAEVTRVNRLDLAPLAADLVRLR